MYFLLNTRGRRKISPVRYIYLIMRDYNWEDWHLRPDGSGEGALLKGKHLLGLCAVVAGAFWEDDHMRPPLFGLQLKFGSVECQILKSETITIMLAHNIRPMSHLPW